jgi:hypothetical protein
MIDNAAKRASPLSAEEHDLYQAILRAFPTVGGSPSAEWLAAEPVVFYCKPGGQGLGGNGCPVIHRFASRASAERYVQERAGRPGEVRSLTEAFAVGRRQFGTLLAPTREGDRDET